MYPEPLGDGGRRNTMIIMETVRGCCWPVPTGNMSETIRIVWGLGVVRGAPREVSGRREDIREQSRFLGKRRCR